MHCFQAEVFTAQTHLPYYSRASIKHIQSYE